ncbi:MAG: PorT family protein, partial [Flavobacteriales bacterium]|nr:PorT family protein [Flavobacteriales bacterium]
FNAGVYFNFPLTETFAFQPEVNFTTKGATAEYSLLSFDGEYSFNMSYIDVPLMGVIRLDEAFELHLGPYFGLLANTSFSTDGDFGEGQEELDSDNFQNLDYGLAGGLAFNFSAFQVGARYHYGLQEVADSEAAETFFGDARHSYLQVYGALRIGEFD